MKSANVFVRLGFFFKHKLRGHELGLYSKDLANGFKLFTVDCKQCKNGVMTIHR